MRNRNSIQNGLGMKQNLILSKIQKGHEIIFKELISSFYVVITVILVMTFLTFFLLEDILFIDILFFTLNTSIFTLVALNNIRILWPFWREIDFRFKNIKKKSIIGDSEIALDGITTYVNKIQNMIFNSFVKIKKTPDITSEIFEKEVDSRLNRSWIVHIIIGIIIVVINHLIMVLLISPRPNSLFWLYLSYLGIIIIYGIMVIRDIQTRSLFRRWIRLFRLLDIWGQNLESLPVIKDIDQIKNYLEEEE